MKHRKRTRREFLNEMGGYPAGAVGSGVLGSMVTGCGGDTVVDPAPKDDSSGTPPAPVAAALTGPDELQIPSLGQSVSATYDGSGSKGPITSRTMTVTLENDYLDEQWVSTEVTDVMELGRPGTYTARIRVAGPTSNDGTHINTIVTGPSTLPSQDYDVPLLFFQSVIGGGGWLCSMDRKVRE